MDWEVAMELLSPSSSIIYRQRTLHHRMLKCKLIWTRQCMAEYSVFEELILFQRNAWFPFDKDSMKII